MVNCKPGAKCELTALLAVPINGGTQDVALVRSAHCRPRDLPKAAVVSITVGT